MPHRLLKRSRAECNRATRQGKHATAVPLLVQPSGAVARDSWEIMTAVAGLSYDCPPTEFRKPSVLRLRWFCAESCSAHAFPRHPVTESGVSPTRASY